MEGNAIEQSPFAGDEQKDFSGYQWMYYASLQEGPICSRAESFLLHVNWIALLGRATKQRNGIKCQLLPDIGLGYNHMVRIIGFDDGIRWVARLRLPSLTNSDIVGRSNDSFETMERCEYSTISIVRQMTSIPVPRVHVLETQTDCDVAAAFMLMDCLPGNVGMDLGMKVPSNHKEAFVRSLAKIHVDLSKIQLPKIGPILCKNNDGTYQQGPIPGLGGPFDTATEFFEAWAAKARFSMTDEQLRIASGKYADEIISSVSSFPESIRKVAGQLSVHDSGPFPLFHGDFGHNNVVVDDEYRILGVIDWESAFAAPWEVLGDFPLFLTTTPPIMDAPRNYDEQGHPTSPELRQQFADQEAYVAAIRQEEDGNGGSHWLSEAFYDSHRQQLVAAMRLYQNGKVGWYSKLTERFTETLSRH